MLSTSSYSCIVSQPPAAGQLGPPQPITQIDAHGGSVSSTGWAAVDAVINGAVVLIPILLSAGIL
jgi:hypothetical protein